MLLDIGLPSMDGFEVLRHLRGQGSTLPVIMLTARSSTRDTVDGLDAGANDYVAKPFKFDELLARVRSRLRETVQTGTVRSEEHTSELQSLMRISYAVFCLKKKQNPKEPTTVTLGN